jgi:hypothetical protein
VHKLSLLRRRVLVKYWSSELTRTCLRVPAATTFFSRTHPGVLPTDEARRKRVRACVDVSLSFVLSVDNEREWFAEPEIML